MEKNVTKIGKKRVGNGIFFEKPKYKLAELLYNLPYNEAKQVKKQLPKVLGISRQTLQLYLKATTNDKTNIPLNEFLRLCVFFNIKPFEMLNYEIEEIIIVDESNIEEIIIVDESNIEQKKLSNKIGLVK